MRECCLSHLAHSSLPACALCALPHVGQHHIGAVSSADIGAAELPAVSSPMLPPRLPCNDACLQDKFNACMEASGKDFLKKVPKLKADILAALKRV